jgi:hypothetical protein
MGAEMGYRKDKRFELHIVTLADGEMVFTLRRGMSSVMATKRREYLGLNEAEQGKKYAEHALDAVCDLIAEDPHGVEDWPVDCRPIAARTREFFSDPANHDLMTNVYGGYLMATKPSGMFHKGIPGDGAGDAGTQPAAGGQGGGAVPGLPAELREDEPAAGGAGGLHAVPEAAG